ncbi:hypothetical protein C9374_009558 [Naegleria lovaniensis]|uniref:WH2 domain-containing protein n=1 Tax=Naegleria lovaniensis TaxID=51637 RepID=A0AA88H533_NAELO|nr:uncharacterized protein C9374_009558 [Naegleria lovaniensis]KAG2392981.1 hypothetical protein C9374_009558 [Naegleria lovaniensis]
MSQLNQHLIEQLTKTPEEIAKLEQTEQKIGGIINWCAYNYQNADKASTFEKTQDYLAAVLTNVVFYVESSSRELETLIELEAQEINRIGSEMTIIYDRLKSARSLTGREELTKMHAVKPTVRTGLKKRSVDVSMNTTTTTGHTKDMKMSNGEINLNSCSNIGISIGGSDNYSSMNSTSMSTMSTTTTSTPTMSTSNSFYNSRVSESGSSFIRTTSTARLGTPVNLEVPSSPSSGNSSSTPPMSPPPPPPSQQQQPSRSNMSMGVPPPPPPSREPQQYNDYNNNYSPPPPPPSRREDTPPPPPPMKSTPPPPPPSNNFNNSPPPPPPMRSQPSSDSFGGVPPPPPSSGSGGVPPPPPSGGGGVPPPPSKMVSPPPPPKNVDIPEDPSGGGRGDLLASIRAGKALKKVPPPNDAPKLPSKTEMGGGSASTSSSSGGGGGDMMSQIMAKRNRMMNK